MYTCIKKTHAPWPRFSQLGGRSVEHTARRGRHTGCCIEYVPPMYLWMKNASVFGNMLMPPAGFTSRSDESLHSRAAQAPHKYRRTCACGPGQLATSGSQPQVTRLFLSPRKACPEQRRSSDKHLGGGVRREVERHSRRCIGRDRMARQAPSLGGIR